MASDGATSEMQCRWLVNCAGLLGAGSAAAESMASRRTDCGSAFYAKGNYFACQGVQPFRRLVYPMPNEGGGSAFTLRWTSAEPRASAPMSNGWQSPSTASIPLAPVVLRRNPRILAGYPAGSLQPAYAGVRPKLVGPGTAAG